MDRFTLIALLVIATITASITANLIDTANSARKWHDRAMVQTNRAFDAEAERDFCKLALHAKK